jgi:magnesium chelatase subunit I
MVKKLIFPFTAIAGQDEMKLALTLNVIDPRIGGVLIMGDRGTGKSTTIRAVADLLPQIVIVAGDPFNSSGTDPDVMSEEVRQVFTEWTKDSAKFCSEDPNDVRDGSDATLVPKKEESLPLPYKLEPIQVPMIDLPLGATEDRVCGTIDIQKALKDGVKAFEPGLLAKANRGILYVDEINLLDAHLVDVLLDAAASGWNTVEREGISIRHPARFVLVGSGNPEEGDLRPQLLDRFGMHAEVRTVRDPETRLRVVDERIQFDMNPDEVFKKHEPAQNLLKEQIIKAQNNLQNVSISRDLCFKISEVCGELDIDGLRGDIVLTRAAKALAAFENCEKVKVQHIYEVVKLCLRHRLRKDPLEPINYELFGQKIQHVFQTTFADEL